MMELLKDKKTENIHRQFVDLNREIKKAMPELMVVGQCWWFYVPPTQDAMMILKAKMMAGK